MALLPCGTASPQAGLLRPPLVPSESMSLSLVGLRIRPSLSLQPPLRYLFCNACAMEIYLVIPDPHLEHDHYVNILIPSKISLSSFSYLKNTKKSYKLRKLKKYLSMLRLVVAPNSDLLWNPCQHRHNHPQWWFVVFTRRRIHHQKQSSTRPCLQGVSSSHPIYPSEDLGGYW